MFRFRTLCKRAAGVFALAMTLVHLPHVQAATSAEAGGVHSESAERQISHIPLFPPASDPTRQGFVRVINHGETTHEVDIHAIDDEGTFHGPVFLEVASGHSSHFNSNDLENGNPEKGLNGRMGRAEGTRRLEVGGGPGIEVLGYIRTEDGFLTPMHDQAPREAGIYRVPVFNPASNRNQRSALRLINPVSVEVDITIEGIDDEGRSPGTRVGLSLPSAGARTLSARQLEEGDMRLSGSLGDGSGKWRLNITADQPILVVNTLESPTGHLTNLSTVPDLTRPPGATLRDTRISGRRVIFSVADQVRALEAADVDGDGDSDVVVAVNYYEGDRIVWFENLGDGAFSSERAAVPDIDRLALMTVSDLDQDGDPDLVYTTDRHSDNHIAWSENLGGGSFSDERVITVEAEGFWDPVTAADIDGDGDNDIVAALFPGGRTLWYENAGDSTWTQHRIAEIAQSEGSLQAEDIDGDGDPDIVLAASNGSSDLDVVWLENLGGGKFSPQRTIAEGVTRLDKYLVADLDGDGDGDIVMVSSIPDELRWVENLGGGRFSERRLIAGDARGATSVDAADFDGDGDLDLLSFRNIDYSIVWYRNLGGGAFSEERLIATRAGNPVRLETTDIDADGDLDVLVAEGTSVGPETIAWYENLESAVGSVRARIVPGVAQFWVTWTVSGTPPDGAGYRFRVTAVSEDGRHRRECTATFSLGCTVTGLRAGHRYGVTVAVEGGAFHTATLTAAPLEDAAVATEFSEPLAISTGGDTRGPATLLAADLDGDGDPDLVDDGRRADPRPVAWRENLGGGSFSERRTVSGGLVDAVAAADLDGDGDVDLLSAAFGGEALSFHENTGGGTFAAAQSIDTDPEAARSVRTGDMDGDGDPDVIATVDVDRRETELRWYEYLGAGSFGPANRVAAAPDLIQDVHPADIDGDGDIDLLGAYSRYGNTQFYRMEWFENLGAGAFVGPHLIRTEDRDQSTLHPADLDGDDYVDILAVGTWQGEISWYENRRGGRFSGQRLIDEKSRYWGFDAADMDGDGDVDVVYSSRLRNTIAWRENLGAGVFSSERVIGVDFRGDWSVIVADLDADGNPDVLATFWDRGETYWFRNLGTTQAPAEAPANVRVVAGVGLLWVTWDALPGLGDSVRAQARYLVTARAPDGSVAGTCIAVEVIGCTVTGLTPGTTYAVSVRGENELGEGPESQAVSAAAAADTSRPGTRFSGPHVITTEAVEVLDVHAADLDGDRDLDALSASYRDDTVAWYENAGTGFLPARNVITMDADAPTDVRTGDLDGDGDEDVLSWSLDDRKVAWYENLGGGLFASQNVIAMDIASFGSLDVVDLDGDGDKDVVIGGPGKNGLDWYENLGGAIFDGPRIVSESDANPGAIASPADLDGDGDPDLLTTTVPTSGIGWHENLGGGLFSAVRLIARDLQFTASLAAADIDGDGDPDIVHGSGWDNTVAWFENRSGGSFYGRRIVATDIEHISSVTSADLDADGDMDIVVVSYDDDRVAWFENLDRGRFSGTRVVTMAADGATAAVAADLDNDGDADILSASARDNTVAWYENLGSTGETENSSMPGVATTDSVAGSNR